MSLRAAAGPAERAIGAAVTARSSLGRGADRLLRPAQCAKQSARCSELTGKRMTHYEWFCGAQTVADSWRTDETTAPASPPHLSCDSLVGSPLSLHHPPSCSTVRKQKAPEERVWHSLGFASVYGGNRGWSGYRPRTGEWEHQDAGERGKYRMQRSRPRPAQWGQWVERMARRRTRVSGVEKGGKGRNVGAAKRNGSHAPDQFRDETRVFAVKVSVRVF